MAAVLSLRKLPVDLASQSDADLLVGWGWEPGAPVDLVTAARSGDPVRFGKVWRQDLRARRSISGTPKELLALWTPGAETNSAVSHALAALHAAAGKQRARRPSIKPKASWLVRVQPLVKALTAPDRPDATDLVAVLAALELLWTIGDRLPQRFWWPLWRRTLADAAQFLSHDPPSDMAPDEKLLLAGELPLLAGLVFRSQSGSRELIRKGQRVLTRELSSRTDTDGTPHGELLPRLPYWLAPLVRVTGWCHQAGQSLWDHDQRELLSDLTEKAVALCRPDGKLALTNGRAADALPILRHAADLLGWPTSNPSRACLKSLAEHAAGGKPRNSGTAAISVMPSNQSDWARFALLRTDWTAGAASVAIAHHQPLPQLDVTVAGESLLQGSWDLDVRLGDAGIELADEWACVCWESQPEADYAELQMTGPGRLRIERLILLSREDGFLMLADSISGAPAGPLALRSRLRLAPGITANWESGQRSARLEGSKVKVRMLPLSLPADTVHSSPHLCQIEDQTIVLEQRANGQGLFAPLIFDFSPSRRRKEVTWRSLTVTEDGNVVSSDIAAAYRWQIAQQQWLVYRSLRKPNTPRAALGYHTGNGFVMGRFDRNGDVDPMLMVEG